MTFKTHATYRYCLVINHCIFIDFKKKMVNLGYIKEKMQILAQMLNIILQNTINSILGNWYLFHYSIVIVYILEYFVKILKVTQKKERQVQNRALINLNKQLAEALLYYKSFI